MNPVLVALVCALVLFAGMLLCLNLGRRMGRRRLAEDHEGTHVGVGAIDGAVFGLLGLLIAFTFSGAAGRFDKRRELIIQETNAIGTAYLRLDLLPAEAQPALREAFRQYAEARLDVFRNVPDMVAVQRGLDECARFQREIWRAAVQGCRGDAPPSAAMLLLPALNEMIDIAAAHTLIAAIHPPPIVFVMLGGLALASALLAGYGLAGSGARSWMHSLTFASILAITTYVIIDIEYPRLGLVRVDAFDQALAEVRASME